MIADQSRHADIALAATERQESDVLFLLHDCIVDRDRLDCLEVGFYKNVFVGLFHEAFSAGRRGHDICQMMSLKAIKECVGPYHGKARIPEMASLAEILLGDTAFGLFNE